VDADPLELQDIAPAEPYLLAPGWPWWAWTLLALGLVALGWLLLHARRRAAPPPLPGPVEPEAYRRARLAIAAEEAAEPRHLALTVSSALRGYLAESFADPSLYETHEEFLARHQALEEVPESLRDRVSTLFCRLARLKYGRQAPASDPTEVREQSLALLDDLHQQARP